MIPPTLLTTTLLSYHQTTDSMLSCVGRSGLNGPLYRLLYDISTTDVILQYLQTVFRNSVYMSTPLGKLICVFSMCNYESTHMKYCSSRPKFHIYNNKVLTYLRTCIYKPIDIYMSELSRKYENEKRIDACSRDS